jgi:ribosome-binding factor A
MRADVSRRASPNPSRRTERIASLIRALIAEEIQHGLSDPRIPTITSITRVEVAPDLTVARVFVSVMSEESQRKLCLSALESAAGHLRWLVGRELDLRRTPELSFRLDDSVRGAFETVERIDRLMNELEPDGGAARNDEAGDAEGELTAEHDQSREDG